MSRRLCYGGGAFVKRESLFVNRKLFCPLYRLSQFSPFTDPTDLMDATFSVLRLRVNV